MSAASAGRKSDSGSEAHCDLTQTLMKSCESMSSQQLQEFTNALLSIQKSSASGSPKSETAAGSGEGDGECSSQLMVPKFRVGSFTTAALMASETRLGALAALSNYMHEDEQQAGEQEGEGRARDLYKGKRCLKRWCMISCPTLISVFFVCN